MGEGGRGDHQVDGAAATGLASFGLNSRGDDTIRTRASRIERQGFQVRLDELEMALASRSIQLIGRGRWSGDQLRKRQGRYRYFSRKLRRVKIANRDRDRGIDQPAIFTQSSSEA